MIIVFYILAAILVFFSFKSFRGGVGYLSFFRSELAGLPGDHRPFATLIVPCRGLEAGLEKNLAAFASQNYPGYEILFVVDDANDPAAGVISELQSAQPVKLIVAPRAVRSSQKVENLREAVLHADARSEVFVFGDSDARPSPSWLRSLVEPLLDPAVGAATGYRWYVSKETDFASEMRSAWNASIASALGPNARSNFCWGGATAIRRETFELLGIRNLWDGTLSDDFAVTRALRRAGLEIRFVPRALTASEGKCTFRELTEFTTRQMKITRVYAPELWALSFFGSGLFTIVMVAAAMLLSFGGGPWHFWPAAGTVFLVVLFSLGKAWLRLRAVMLAMDGHRRELARQIVPQCTLWLIVPPLFLYNCVAASVSRTIDWRGTKYRLVSAVETEVIG